MMVVRVSIATRERPRPSGDRCCARPLEEATPHIRVRLAAARKKLTERDQPE
jgi:hypothetical protein